MCPVSAALASICWMDSISTSYNEPEPNPKTQGVLAINMLDGDGKGTIIYTGINY